METRNVTLTLEKAKEFYNSGNAALKEIALQAFTQEELTTPKYTNIKTFEGACRTLGIVYRADCDLNYLSRVEGNLGKHLTAIYKLDIIRKALNGGETPSLVSGNVYYPWVRFYRIDEAPSALDLKKNGWVLGDTFKHNGTRYILVGGDSNFYGGNYGVGGFCRGSGYVDASAGLLCCKSREIAQHMSRHFSRLIFDAMYSQYDLVNWEN